jgi:hypothetical protein
MGRTRTRRSNQQQRNNIQIRGQQMAKASAQLVGYRDLIGAIGGRWDEEIGGDFDSLGDVLGDDEMAGDELGDVLGDELSGLDSDQLGAVRRILRRSRRRNTARGDRTMANRIYDLGLGSVTIAAGAVGQLTGAPAIRFRVDRLFLVPTAPGLLLLDVKAGIVSQSVGGAGSPVESFSPQAIGARMSGQTLDPAVPVILTISNPTLAAITISGNIIGKADQ